MTLAVVAYPRMEAQSLRLIESFRASHDPLADFIKAHITLVFPVDADSEELAQEVRSIAASAPAFAINLLGARASVGIDRRSYALLEPDSGGEAISSLHDRLYSKSLARHVRTDVTYEPHMTVGSCEHLPDCVRMTREFNTSWRPSPGHIDELVLLDLEGTSPRELGVFSLLGDGSMTSASS